MRPSFPVVLGASVATAALACGPAAPGPPELPVATVELPPPAAASPAREPTLAPAASASPTAPPKERVTDDGLRILDLVEGKGAEVQRGDKVKVSYVGRLDDGTVFDSTAASGRPFEATIGQGMLIRGWELGVPGMKKGGKRRLVVPYALAYGEAGRPPKIPPRATLTFEIELL
ncbi:MAG TPA: FKBP-type peptidyl-prolyl cis-trans isomerase, partial [Minicystis sp.]|nr:FKBP-type peptidyl-prolyl cis-trans isomerase [Minicystis sp.]